MEWWKELVLPFEDLLPPNSPMRKKIQQQREEELGDIAVLGKIFDDTWGRTAASEQLPKLRRRIALLEYRIERDKRKARSLGIWAAITLIVGLLPLTLIFIGVAVVRYMKYRSRQEELHTLREQYRMAVAGTSDAQRQVDLEKKVLQAALRHQGKVYPEQLVLECDITLAVAQRFLEQCLKHRIAQLEVDERGRTYYYFPTFDQST